MLCSILVVNVINNLMKLGFINLCRFYEITLLKPAECALMTHEQVTHTVLKFYSELFKRTAVNAMTELKYVILLSFKSSLIFK